MKFAITFLASLFLSASAFASGEIPMSNKSWSDVQSQIQFMNRDIAPTPQIRAVKGLNKRASKKQALKQLKSLDQILINGGRYNPGEINLFSCDHPACNGQ